MPLASLGNSRHVSAIRDTLRLRARNESRHQARILSRCRASSARAHDEHHRCRGTPLLDRMYKEYGRGTAPRVLQEMAEIYRRTDGFAIVSGEYNHGVPPGLKNLLDHFLEEYFFRPSAIVCYSAGQFGGVRAAMQLRMTLAELGMPSIPSLLPIPRVQDAFTPAGDPTDSAFERHSERFFRELEWYAHALQQARADGVPY